VPPDFAAGVAALGGTVESSVDAVGIATVTGLSADAAATLAASSDVAEVQRDETFQVDYRSVDADLSTLLDEASAGVNADATAAATVTPAFYGKRQWNYPAIGADKAWAAGKLGSSAVKVAILDTGIDYTYPDLAPLVDLAHSTSFVPSDAAVGAALFPGQALKPFMDLNGHGTHVASTVASKGKWVKGVTQNVTLMAVKVLGATGGSEGNSVFQGIVYAVDNGADVINMSLGGTFFRAGGGGVGVINRVLNYAHRKGVTVVVSAGNDSWDLQHNGSGYDAYCDAANVICVAATGPTTAGPGVFVNDPAAWTGPFDNVDQPAFYTNFGRNAINVAAPGGNAKLDEKGNLLDAGWVWQACS
jgi:subtilisin family serine protease